VQQHLPQIGCLYIGQAWAPPPSLYYWPPVTAMIAMVVSMD
jgi:hypothetical protein